MVMSVLQEETKSFVWLKDIRWNDERHILIMGNRVVPLTQTEYQLLRPLRNGTAVTYEELAAVVYHCKVDVKVRLMMDKHIDRIRGKLRGTGIYVYCVLGYGYMLLPEIY